MNKEKINKRKAQAAGTKKKIYESAEQLFKKYGFDNVSVDSIVEKAGVSKGAFYVHFSSKNSLIAALGTDFANKLDLDYKSYLESLPSGTLASDLLVQLAIKVADTITSTIGYDLIKFIYEAYITKTIDTEAVSGYNRDLNDLFRKVISQGIDRGEFKKGLNIDTITKHCFLSLRGLTYEWCIRYPDFNLKKEVQEHFEILLSGIKKQ